MHDDVQHDEALAAFTDDLLSGGDPIAPENIQGLAVVVRQLHAVIPTNGVDPAMRDRLAQRLKLEWDLRYPHTRWWQGRFVRRASLLLVAGLVFVVAAVIGLFMNEEDPTGPLQGTTAVEPLAGLVLVVLLVVGGLSLFVLFRRSR